MKQELANALQDIEDQNDARILLEKTARKLALERQKLEETIATLEKERELRNRFVAALTHDLRTPLTSAKMTAQLLSKKTSDPILHKLSDRIVRSMDRADKMIRDILDANHIQAGESLPLNKSDCDLIEIYRPIALDLKLVHGDRFRLIEPTTTTLVINGHWDADAIRRIIENLVNNAVKYGTEKTPITLSFSQTKNHVEIAVHNEGNPISLEDQKNLFQNFKRTQSALNGNQKGWGIGLTLVRGLVDAHEGTVLVKSSPKKGTTFCVHLPNKGKMD